MEASGVPGPALPPPDPGNAFFEDETKAIDVGVELPRSPIRPAVDHAGLKVHTVA